MPPCLAVLLFFICLCCANGIATSVMPPFSMDCIGDSNTSVEWWLAFKFPYGTSYAYADNTQPSLQPSQYLMADQQHGALSWTVSQVYVANRTGSTDESGFVLYNDESPNGKDSSSRGHTKGVVGLNPEAGFWLIHSLPKYPAFIKDGFQGWGHASQTYGQSFLCVSLPTEEFATVGLAFQLNYPQYYDWSLPKWVPAPLSVAVSQSLHSRDPITSSNYITTRSGLVFQVFAKTAQWNNSLYAGLVAPTLSTNLLVETWMNGDHSNQIPSVCANGSNYDVLEVRNLSFQGIAWRETEDHSKWCVSIDSGHKSAALHYLCVGDINQQYSQNTRGGGTVCQSKFDLWASVMNLVVGADSCPVKRQEMESKTLPFSMRSRKHV
eukprot:gb/GEZN01007336.1/.p1 GENE.gb/GEZN01007336.1/~~gb/GEZN01007336.1/.p1  ORF type:complete len:380 (-),score=40.91 gb/GEZN01007336.1/:236-1375(-)